MSPKYKMPDGLPVPPGESEAAAPDSPLVVQLALSRATDLARAGKHEEAVGLLTELRLAPRQAVAVFHLCARVRAQIGQYEDAAELWKRVLQVDPGHEGARSGIREIQRLRARPLWLSTLLAWPIALAVLAGALLLLVSRPAPREDMDLLLAEQKRLSSEVERLRGAIEGPRPAAAPDFEAGELPVTTEAKGEERVLRFKAALFDAGNVELRADAKALLALLAGKLEGKADVSVVGYAVEPVDEPQARRRAEAVADQLRVLRPKVLDLPGSEAPGPGEAIALRLSRVKK